ncbi:MAG: addiction module toxin RelE [Deltaproteobacteria bacterium]|nr:addiction module toxin RelE [Deltaproteobacteria bacterium]
MARPLRIEFDGALYHVTSRGNDRKAIYKDDADRELFLNTLAQVNERFHWICHAYCLMNNHYHLVIETPDGNLSKGMRQLNGVYTQAFNKRHRRAGHIFQGRFKGILVQKDSHFLEVCRYVVLNPVRAKMVGQPRQWKWTSYRATAGNSQPDGCLTIDEILSHFGQRKAAAQNKFGEFVQAGIGSPSIWDDLEAQSLLGVEGFAEGLRHHVTGKRKIREIPKGQRFAGRPALAKIFSQSARQKKSRNQLIAKAVTEHGYSQAELASHLDLHYSTISRIVATSAKPSR